MVQVTDTLKIIAGVEKSYQGDITFQRDIKQVTLNKNRNLMTIKQ